ncbi:MAG: hypothetical protein Aureis2KO_21000 [Aureisphaera sp.]
MKPQYYLLCVFFFLGPYVQSQTTTFEYGKVIDSVNVKGANETFALYLPKRYDPNVRASVIYIFDPMARGRLGVELFVPSAEKYNYILICSNHTRNFREDNFDIINRLFDTVFNMFPIDERLVYTAGFSGGSRLAASVAVLTNQIEGVIGCGAGFSPIPAQTPNPSNNFSYVGFVGALDMNYHEMYNAQTYLNKINLQNELFTNGDRHRWPSPDQLVKGIGFLELQAYKKGRKPVDNNIVSELYELWYKDGHVLEKNGNLVKAVEVYSKLKRNFARYYKLDSIAEKIQWLRSRKEFKKEEKLIAGIQEEEDRVKKKFFDRLKRELNMSPPPIKFKWWEKEFPKFREKYAESEELVLQELGARVENMVFAAAVETAQIELGGRNMKKVFYCHRLLATIQPDAAYPQFLLAKDYSFMNNKEKMLEHLYLAKEKGWKERKYIENDEAFLPWKNDADFNEFLNGLQ